MIGRLGLLVVLSCALAWACSSSSTNPATNTDASVGGGGTTGGSGGASGGSAGATGGSGGVVSQAPPCDPNEAVDAASGVFVSNATGDDVNGNGSALNPLKTIAKGIQSAATAQKKVVYLDTDIYLETLVFTAAEGGITVRGGFQRKGTSWVRDCEAYKNTLVQSADAIAVDVNGTTTTSGLSELTVTTKASGASNADAAGESVYAIRVAGDGTKFSLTGVTVIAGDGGSGGPATKGVTPAAPTGTCGSTAPACSDGATGGNGLSAAAASAGAFSAGGYAPGNGDPGSAGQPGHNGAPGGTSSQSGCTTCSNCGALHCNCACCQTGCGNWCEAGTQGSTTVTTQPGPCGCGGNPGPGGQPGRGGGASVALFISGNATVSTSYVSLNAGNGGAGSPGGNGASGSAGSDGTTASASCATGNCTCNFNYSSCNGSCGTSGPTTQVTSKPGQAGGSGGAGTKGGGGAGAPTYAAVLAAGATLVDDHTELHWATGGSGADGAPSGAAGDRLVVQ